MDYLQNLGASALASRMKRLVGILNQNVKEIYVAENLEFEPLLMPITRLLHTKGHLSVNQIADNLGVTQPAATQLCQLLKEKEMIRVDKHPEDKRIRIVCLTENGRAMVVILEPVWLAIQQGVAQMMEASQENLLNALGEFETQSDQKSLKSRVLDILRQQRESAIEIIPYDPIYNSDFKALNYEWIKRDFKVEEQDRQVLSNPQQEIIKKGGYIFFVRFREEIVATCALIRCSDNKYELAKMAVAFAHQKKGIGTHLVDYVIDQAIFLGINRLVVYSHTDLAAAINLYFKKGFRVVPKTDHHNNRANIKMELLLGS